MKDELLVMNKQMARGGIDWIWTCIWSKRKDEVVRGEHGSWPLVAVEDWTVALLDGRKEM